MKKVNLLSRAEMKNVIGGVESLDNEDGPVAQCQKAGDFCKAVAPGGATVNGKCVQSEVAPTLVCEPI